MKHPRALYLFALLLPLVFLGIECAYNIYFRTVAPVYTVAIEAYDPRDLLMGKYLQYRFEWDDPASQKPAGKTTQQLPATGRYYLPEGDAADMQAMIARDQHLHFIASVSLMGKHVVTRDISVDGKPWPQALADWRAKRYPPPCAPTAQGISGIPGCVH